MNKIETTQIGFNEISAEITNDNIIVRMIEEDNDIDALNECVIAYVIDCNHENSGWCMEYNIETKDLYVNYNQFYDIDEGLTEKEYNTQYEDLQKYYDDIKASIKRLITYFKKYKTNKIKKIRRCNDGNNKLIRN